MTDGREKNKLIAAGILKDLTYHTSRMGGTSAVLISPMGTGKSTLLYHLADMVRCKDPISKKVKKEIRIWRGRFIDTWSYAGYDGSIVYVHAKDAPKVTFSLELTEPRQIIHPELKIYATISDLVRKMQEDPDKLHVVYPPQEYQRSPVMDELLMRLPEKVQIPQKLEPNLFWYELIYYLVVSFPRSNHRNFYSLFLDEADQIVPEGSSQLQWHLNKWLKEIIVDTRKSYISLYLATHEPDDMDYRIIRKLPFRIWGSGAKVPKYSVVSQTYTNMLPVGSFIFEKNSGIFGTAAFPALPEGCRAMTEFSDELVTKI